MGRPRSRACPGPTDPGPAGTARAPSRPGARLEASGKRCPLTARRARPVASRPSRHGKLWLPQSNQAKENCPQARYSRAAAASPLVLWPGHLGTASASSPRRRASPRPPGVQARRLDPRAVQEERTRTLGRTAGWRRYGLSGVSFGGGDSDDPPQAGHQDLHRSQGADHPMLPETPVAQNPAPGARSRYPVELTLAIVPLPRHLS